jgi:hypothetical protein
MVQDPLEEPQGQEGALDGAVAVDLGQGENVSAPIVAIEPLTRQVPPATRFSALNVAHQ